jgi:hypothetical protein
LATGLRRVTLAWRVTGRVVADGSTGTDVIVATVALRDVRDDSKARKGDAHLVSVLGSGVLEALLGTLGDTEQWGETGRGEGKALEESLVPRLGNTSLVRPSGGKSCVSLGWQSRGFALESSGQRRYNPRGTVTHQTMLVAVVPSDEGV